MMLAYARRQAWQADVTAAAILRAYAMAMGGKGPGRSTPGGGRVSSDELLMMMGDPVVH